MANDYTKFNVTMYDGNIDCRAFYKDSIGIWHRLGADENNNVEKPLTAINLSKITDVAYSSLKTESEMNADL